MRTGMKILFISKNDSHCGVADYGLRLFNILSKAFDITMAEEGKLGYDIFLYNYHYATLPFVNDEYLKRFLKTKHVVIYHEAYLEFTPDKVLNTWIRPLFEYWHPVVKNNIPVIGSFGFGFPDKNYSRIAEMVADQYNEAILRLNIPFAKYGDEHGFLANQEADKVKKILSGTKIKVDINHNYLGQMQLLEFLNGNDLNLFLYLPSSGRGLASATDYALSVRKPIGVSNSEMFRHLPKEICVDNVPLRELTIEPLKDFYNNNSNDKLIDYYRTALKF